MVAVGYNTPERDFSWSLWGKTHQKEALGGCCGVQHTRKRLLLVDVGYNTPQRGFICSLWGITHEKEASAGRCGA